MISSAIKIKISIFVYKSNKIMESRNPRKTVTVDKTIKMPKLTHFAKRLLKDRNSFNEGALMLV